MNILSYWNEILITGIAMFVIAFVMSMVAIAFIKSINKYVSLVMMYIASFISEVSQVLIPLGLVFLVLELIFKFF